MRAKLRDAGLTLATIAIASVAAWLAISQKLPTAIDSILWIPPPIQGQPAAPIASQSQPKRVLEVPALDFSRSRRTLLVVVRSDCRFCTASKPFYAELLKHERLASSSTRVFLVGPVSDMNFSNYLTDLPFGDERRIQMATAGLGVTGTPTLLLVDHNGGVEQIWLGKLSSAEEMNVISVTFPATGE